MTIETSIGSGVRIAQLHSQQSRHSCRGLGVWASPTFTWLRLFGVTADGREFALDANRYVGRFDQSRLPKAPRRVMDRPNGLERARAGMPDLFARYEALRATSATARRS